MTKFNPRFEPLQSWYFRDVGDSFAEFKAGGIAVVCGFCAGTCPCGVWEMVENV
jgi:hypothetical protein